MAALTARLIQRWIGQMVEERLLDWAFNQITKSQSANHVLIVMARRANGTGTCFMSQRRIADEVGCSIETVGRAIRWLKNKNFIFEARDCHQNRRTKSYRFAFKQNYVSQTDRSTSSKSRVDTCQIDEQNLKESQIESYRGQSRLVDKLCKTKNSREDTNPKRQKRAIQIGMLVR